MRYLCNHECLDLSGVWDMWADTQIDHRTTSVDSGGGAIGNFRLNDVLLVFIVLKGILSDVINSR